MVDRSKLLARLERMLRKEKYAEKTGHDIAFHMTDWLDDIDSLLRGWNDPKATHQQLYSSLQGFLIHAPAHIVAARKLFLGDPVTDVFGIAAVAVDRPARNRPRRRQRRTLAAGGRSSRRKQAQR